MTTIVKTYDNMFRARVVGQFGAVRKDFDFFIAALLWCKEEAGKFVRVYVRDSDIKLGEEQETGNVKWIKEQLE